VASVPAFAYHYSNAAGLPARWSQPLGAFGEKLRKQREQRGLALDAISNSTKISGRMLRALEDEHFDQLPGGVFNKGFVRAYARQVGLNEEEAVTDYLAALRESQIQQQPVLPDFRAPAGKFGPAPSPDLRHDDVLDNNAVDDNLPKEDAAGDHASRRHAEPIREERRTQGDRRHREEQFRSPNSASDSASGSLAKFPAEVRAGEPAATARVPWAALAAALLLVMLVLAFWNFHGHRRVSAAAHPPATPPSALGPMQSPASSNSLTVGKSTPPGPLASGTRPPGTISAGANLTKTVPTLAGASSSSNQSASAFASTANRAVAKSKIPAPSPKPPPTFTVLIRAEKTSWVSIVADGKPVAEENLIAPAQTSVRASHEVYVRAGNAAGVSFQLNGKEFPAQGHEGEVKTYIFDATSMHVDAQATAGSPNH